MHKIVHLDCKGAPLKVNYLKQLFPILKQWGATGVLMEWEDTFPFTGILEEVGSLCNSGGDNLYTMKEVQEILKLSRDNGLEPIQLVQTMGHLEYVLKHPKFRTLRELEQAPAILCPASPDSKKVIEIMIEQAIEAQPDAKYFHIGADEVWHAGLCPQCVAKAKEHKHREASLYLDHIKSVILFVKEKNPGVTVLMWDDMLRNMDSKAVADYNLGEIVVPVVWHYNPIECFNIDKTVWNTYSDLFPEVWVGTAYKGASGSCQVLGPVCRYVSNHEAWLIQIKAESERINFKGFILTGWSRYDHYAALCELMPPSLPSLASCLRVLDRIEGKSREETQMSEVLPAEEWPGLELSKCIHAFIVMRDRYHSLINCDLITTWMNPWQLEHNFTLPVHIEGIVIATQHLLSELAVVQTDMTTFLHDVTGERSTDEWVKTNITVMVDKLTQICEVARQRCLAGIGVRAFE